MALSKMSNLVSTDDGGTGVTNDIADDVVVTHFIVEALRDIFFAPLSKHVLYV
jgi:hypothetical protein